MGIFDALFGGPKRTQTEVVPEHIWLTTAAKLTGLRNEVAARSQSESVAILLVAHFPDVLTQLKQLVSQLSEGAGANARGSTHMPQVPVMAVLASDLSFDIATSLNLNESATIDLIVGERHPLPSIDDHLARFADELPCRCRLSHHVSLEDPVMATFGGAWVRGMLEKMGMREDEAIESAMVSRRIKQAQRKIEGNVSGTSSADSAAEWLARNCPNVKE